jgi:hypothetical protein
LVIEIKRNDPGTYGQFGLDHDLDWGTWSNNCVPSNDKYPSPLNNPSIWKPRDDDWSANNCWLGM